MTKPSRDAKRPISLFPPKATSKIFIQSRFSLFSCRALPKHLRTRTGKNAGMNLDAHTWNRATNGDHHTSWIFCPEEKMIFPFRLYLLLLVENFRPWSFGELYKKWGRLFLAVTVFAWSTCATFLHMIFRCFSCKMTPKHLPICLIRGSDDRLKNVIAMKSILH